MPTRNVNLTPHFNDFIEDGVASGRFSNASEVVREGLRLLEQREAENKAKLEWLRNATQNAFTSLDRGEGIEFASIDDLAKHIERMDGVLAAKARHGQDQPA